MDKEAFTKIFPQWSNISDEEWAYYSTLADMYLKPLLPCVKDQTKYNLILFQLIAHLLTLRDRGGQSGAISSASDDVASIGYAIPTLGNKSWWLSTSYGANAYQFVKRCQVPFLVSGETNGSCI